MSRPTRLVLLLIAALWCACDNVGRAFDPSVGSGSGTTTIQVVPPRGVARDGRPKVQAAYPSGSGWPSTVPIVVEFSESVNTASIAPSSPQGTDGRIGVRIRGTNQLLPASYDFLAGGRLLVIRPLTPLSSASNQTFEVVLLPDARDVDGTRFAVSGGQTVLTDFQVNQAQSIVDGRVLALFPRDNATDLLREGRVIVVFDRPANPASLVAGNISLRPRGGAELPAELRLPLQLVGVPDSRLVRIEPNAALLPSTTYELVLTAGVTFGNTGELDFRNRTPFASMRTVAPAPPAAVELGNPTPGFPNRINLANVASVQINVTTPADARAGDTVRARVYAGDARTTVAGDLFYVERTAQVTADGPQIVPLDFGDALGTPAARRADEGGVTFAALMQRGSQTSGFVHHDAGSAPVVDLTPPQLVTAGPPASTDGQQVFTDLEFLAFFGTASEEVREATITVGGPEVPIFGFAAQGAFVTGPVTIGRRSAPLPYSLLLRDAAGNLAAAPATGAIVSRGVVTGTPAGELVVEAYDDATLRPVAGATVLVDPGEPLLPAVGQQAGVTAANGRVAFAIGPGPHTVTIVRSGYDLVTLYATTAAYVSLPLRPTGGAHATFRGVVELPTSPGTTALVGNNAVVGGGVLGISTAVATPTVVPPTPIRSNRAQVVTAFGGAFEPTALPGFALEGCLMLGPAFNVQRPPVPPAAPGTEAVVAVGVRLAALPLGVSAAPYAEDFGLAAGLDLANLVTGRPRVRTTMSLLGFTGQALAGAGYIVGVTGTTYEIGANFSLPIVTGLGAFSPLLWLVSDAQDSAGRISRTRALLQRTGGLAAGLGPPPIPTLATPSGPAVGSPAVSFVDVLAPVPGIGGLAIYDVSATDPAGRRWLVLVPDRDPAGGSRTVQFPDLAAHQVSGLAPGSWNVQVEARLFQSLTLASADDCMLSERFRTELTYARSAPAPFQVQ